MEFLQARSRERRSQSFDEEISDLAEHEAKLCEKLKLNHNRCVSKNDVTSSLTLDTRVEDGLGVEVQDEPKSNAEFLEERSESCVVSKGAEIECRCGKKDQLHDSGILYDRCDEDLESRSVSLQNKFYFCRRLSFRFSQMKKTTNERTEKIL